MNPQVEKSHYSFNRYMSKRRWISLWHQLDEVLRLKPRNVLEIGPGPGLFKANATTLGLHVETLDLDPTLSPDHVASVFEIPFSDAHFDVVCAFQMLEHLPFDESIKAFREMARTSSKFVIISLPDAATRWPISIDIPGLGSITFSIPRPRLKPRLHKFDGEHYWEINKRGYPTSRIIKTFSEAARATLIKTYRVPENPYHRFFVFSAHSAALNKGRNSAHQPSKKT